MSVNGVYTPALSQAPPPPFTQSGVELGSSITTAPFTITTTVAAVTGLAVPVIVPPGVAVKVEGLLPAVNMGAVATTVVAEIFRDNVQIAAAIVAIPLNTFGELPIDIPDSPTPGAHIYSVQAGLGVASATTVSQAGAAVFGLYNIFPYLRVVTV